MEIAGNLNIRGNVGLSIQRGLLFAISIIVQYIAWLVTHNLINVMMADINTQFEVANKRPLWMLWPTLPLIFKFPAISIRMSEF